MSAVLLGLLELCVDGDKLVPRYVVNLVRTKNVVYATVSVVKDEVKMKLRY